MKLPKEDYNLAVSYLKRYSYNKYIIKGIENDILGVSAVCYDGQPKAKFKVSDSVFNQVIQLNDNPELQQAYKQITTVDLALKLVSKDAREVFEKYFEKNMSKWQVVETGIGRRTFERRKKELIETVNEVIKKFN